jgi:thiol-disulfide isomerase/thioredoxin
MRRILCLLVPVAVAALVLVGCGNEETTDDNAFRDPKPAPDISGPDQDDQPVSLADYQGKVVLVDFWTSWCGWCKVLVPQLKEMQKRYEGRPFAVLGVNMDKKAEDFKAAVKEEQIPWRVCYDGEAGPLTLKYRIGGFPTVALIDHQGRWRYYYGGKPTAETLDQAVEKLVREAEKDAPKR